MSPRIVINAAHAERHYRGRPTLLDAADAAIRQAISADAAAYQSPGQRPPKRIIVAGEVIEFRPFVRNDGTIHVGTHFPI